MGSIESEFSRIVATNVWGSAETPCGPGSTLAACGPVLARLPVWFARYKISGIADLGCGDWNWMQHLNLEWAQYDGYDVVAEFILMNQRKYGATNVRFHHADVTQMEIPKTDLVLVKDLLQHLPTELALVLVNSIQHSGSRYLAATTAVGAPVGARSNMVAGGFAPLDLEGLPFCLGKPIDAVEVPRKEGNPRKLLGLWNLGGS